MHLTPTHVLKHISEAFPFFGCLPFALLQANTPFLSLYTFSTSFIRFLLVKDVSPFAKLERTKRKTTQAAKHSLHQLRKRSHFGTGYRKAPPPRSVCAHNAQSEHAI